MKRTPLVWSLVAALFVFTLLGSSDSRAQGLEKGKKYLILHADDAGMCHSENLATFEAMEKGIVSSASIMTPCPWFKEAAEYARRHPERDFGVHLTLTCEWGPYRWGPVAPREQVPSLLDEEGYLWHSVQQVAEHAKLEEVERELRAQIERCKQFGVPFTHLDTHMGSVLARPEITQLYVRLGLEYDVPVLMMRDNPPMIKKHPELAEAFAALIQQLDGRKLPVLDRLVQLESSLDLSQRTADYRTSLAELEPGVTQLIVHCGYANEELRGITNRAASRDADRVIFTDPTVIEEVRHLGIELITWKQFRALAQKTQ